MFLMGSSLSLDENISTFVESPGSASSKRPLCLQEPLREVISCQRKAPLDALNFRHPFAGPNVGRSFHVEGISFVALRIASRHPFLRLARSSNVAERADLFVGLPPFSFFFFPETAPCYYFRLIFSTVLIVPSPSDISSFAPATSSSCSNLSISTLFSLFPNDA